MGKRDVIDAVKGLPTSRVPWVPLVGVHGGYLIGVAADRYLRDPDLMAKGVLHAAKRYRADGIPLIFDITLEATCMGCPHQWRPDITPTLMAHPLADQSLSEWGAPVPGIHDGRWPVVIEAGHKVKNELGDVALYGIICGPLTLAGLLRGPRIYSDLSLEKSLAKELIHFAAKVSAESARIYAEVIGCDVLAITDPMCSQIGASAFKELVKPAVEPIITSIKKAGKVSTFFVCGDTMRVLEEMARVGTDGFAVDEQVNLTYARDVALRYGVGFGGNLGLTPPLITDPASIREHAIACLAAGGSTGYVFSTGCDMPYDLAVEYMDSVLRAKDYFENLFPKYPNDSGSW